MQREQPSVVVLAGPNGAGKSTMASQLLVDVLGVSEFVDADVLARGLPRSEAAAVTAGRLMLRRLDALAEGRRSFGFETTSPGIPLVAKRRLCSGEGGRSSTYRSPSYSPRLRSSWHRASTRQTSGPTPSVCGSTWNTMYRFAARYPRRRSAARHSACAAL